MVPSSLSCLSPHFAYKTVLHFVDCVSNTLLLCALVQVCWCLANTVWLKFYESAKYFAECSCSAALVHDVDICIPDKTNSGEKQCVSRIDKAADKEGGSLESSILNDQQYNSASRTLSCKPAFLSLPVFQTNAKCHVHHSLFCKGCNVEQKGDTPGIYQVLKFS